MSILFNNFDVTFEEADVYAAGSGPFSVALRDVDGDTYADILVAVAFDDVVGVLLNNGNGTFDDIITYEI